jgi:hypothetical protein
MSKSRGLPQASWDARGHATPRRRGRATQANRAGRGCAPHRSRGGAMAVRQQPGRTCAGRRGRAGRHGRAAPRSRAGEPRRHGEQGGRKAAPSRERAGHAATASWAGAPRHCTGAARKAAPRRGSGCEGMPWPGRAHASRGNAPGLGGTPGTRPRQTGVGPPCEMGAGLGAPRPRAGAREGGGRRGRARPGPTAPESRAAMAASLSWGRGRARRAGPR